MIRKISDFKYILTDIGGGWVCSHILYGVTSDGTVYTTDEFNEDKFSLDDKLECELLGHIDEVELGLKSKDDVQYGVMDASDLTVYEVSDEIKIIHRAPEISWYNPKIYNDIQYLARNRDLKVTGNAVVIGEVANNEKVEEIIKMMSISSEFCRCRYKR